MDPDPSRRWEPLSPSHEVLCVLNCDDARVADILPLRFRGVNGQLAHAKSDAIPNPSSKVIGGAYEEAHPVLVPCVT